MKKYIFEEGSDPQAIEEFNTVRSTMEEMFRNGTLNEDVAEDLLEHEIKAQGLKLKKEPIISTPFLRPDEINYPDGETVESFTRKNQNGLWA